MSSEFDATHLPLPASPAQASEGQDPSKVALPEESDSEDDSKVALRPQHVTERRRIQNAIFASWLTARAAETTKTEVDTSLKNVEDEVLSIKKLMSKHESQVIISDPREYQLELFERAKMQNTIAVLDTGSGKTLIAVLLLKHILEQELEDRAQGKPRRLAFFLVNSVTLVFQQFAVLEANLDYKFDRFCGDMNTDLWSRSTWLKHFAENKAIVCTAEVLYNCLLHAFISMEEINLLIFDEAHHAKKNHAYARIIRDFYFHQADPTKRPRIFAMTASPVDAKVDVVEAARELEALLDSQIATTSNITKLQAAVAKPTEALVNYDSLAPPHMTPLCSELHRRFGQIEVFSRLFSFARSAASELGDWCADRLWHLALDDDEITKIEQKAERLCNAEKNLRPVEILDEQLRDIRAAKDQVDRYSFPLPHLMGNDISPKVRTLREYLNAIFQNPTDIRCIIFVSQRYTARLLAEVFKHIGSPNLRLGMLIGARAGEAADPRITIRQQIITMMKFRSGEVNCLFATSIAEEGLDIPDCNTIIRFDLYDTLIQYIQSRGRARHRNSRFLHMVERGNKRHAQIVQQVQSSEQLMRQFCEALPADRLLQGLDGDLKSTLTKTKRFKSYREPSTGATLTFQSSLVLLAHFAMCLPQAEESVNQVSYILSTENRQFVCEVILPATSPIRTVTGEFHSQKAAAKRSAAFEACLKLRQGNYLDEHLLPTFHKQLPAMRNAQLALNMTKTNSYTMRIKPDVWKHDRGSLPEAVHMTVLSVQSIAGSERPTIPLGLLTTSPLPHFPSFDLHVEAGKKSGVACFPLSTPLEVSPTTLEALTTFTLRIYKDIYNKTYETNMPEMSYWLAPLLGDVPEDGRGSSPTQLIDWQAIEVVLECEEIPWSPAMADHELADRYLVDRWDGGRRFFSVGVASHLKPEDPLPEGCAASKHMNSILDYSVSLFAASRARATWKLNQPVIEARRVLHRRNLLDEWDEKDQGAKTLAYVCPEPLRFSMLSTKAAAAGYLFPAIIFRLESYLIAQDACNLVGLDIRLDLALEAMTKDSDNTSEHRTEQIHVHRGMGKNYERLEFIGDCFLKMATSIALYARNAGDDEFESHVKRMLMICNKNLFGSAVKLKLFEYVRSQPFSRRTWYPEGLKLLEGKGHKKTGQQILKHQLSSKTIADVCEALIGAALLSHTQSKNMDMAVKAVTAFVSNPEHDMESWDAYYQQYEKPAYQTAPCTAAQLDLAAKTEGEHDYHFRYPRLLRAAFTHPSYPFCWEKIPSYQRLEFLGDSLLDMACVNFLFYRYPDRDPQWLTEHKMAMVSNKFLGALCVRLGFHRHVKQSQAALVGQIQEYVAEIHEAEAEANGARDYWTLTKSPPKCLPDIVESYIGAIFVDSEFCYQEVERFFQQHIQWYFEDMSIYDTFANNHPTTFLSNLLTLSFGCNDFRLMSNELLSLDGTTTRIIAVVMVHNQIIAEATASSGKYAKVKASSNALELLKGLAPFEYRFEYRCNCSDKDNLEYADALSSKETTDAAI